MKTVAICNNTPDYILSLLMDAGVEKANIKLFNVNEVIEDKKYKAEFLMLLTYSDFLRNRETLTSSNFKSKTIFLFSPPIRVKNFSNMYFLDIVTKASNMIKSTFVPINLSSVQDIIAAPHFKKHPKMLHEDYLAALIDNMRSGSLLDPMMTLTYSLRSGLQLKIRELIYEWLFSEASLSELEERLMEFSIQNGITKALRLRLIDLFKSDLGKNYKACLEYVAEQKRKQCGDKKVIVSYKLIAKKFKLPAYEIAYFCKNRYKKTDTSIEGKSLSSVYYGRDRHKTNTLNTRPDKKKRRL